MAKSNDKPNYEKFLASTSKEIMAVKDRVRFLINDKNWGEEGRYKEIILREILRSFLPERYGIGTGFAICKDDKVTSQIDIIIYDKFKADNNAEILKKGDFVVVESKSVVGIIEVKSSFGSKIFELDKKEQNTITKLLDNKQKIEQDKVIEKNGTQYYKENVFAGLFAFERANRYGIKTITKKLKEYLQNSNATIDCISFDGYYFMKFWRARLPEYCFENKHYSFYELPKDLSFGYFISNIVEHLKIWLTHKPLDKSEINRLYPLFGGKEQYRVDDFVVYESEVQ